MITICQNCLIVKGIAIELNGGPDRFWCPSCDSQTTKRFLEVSQLGIARMAEALGYTVDKNASKKIRGKSNEELRQEQEKANARIVESGGRYIELPKDGK